MRFNIGQIALVVIFCLFFTSCGGDEDPSAGLSVEINAENPNRNTLDVGEQIALSVDVVSLGEIEYQWSNSGGNLSEADSQSTIFTAPTTPGTVIVDIEVTSADRVATDSIVFQVIAPTPTATPSPTLTPTPTSSPTPSVTPTATDTPMPTVPPTVTVTPTITPTPIPIPCDHSDLVPGVFAQFAGEDTFSFTGFLGTEFECEGVFDLYRTAPPAVRIHYAGDASSFALWSMGFQRGQEFSGEEICVWLFADAPNQQFDLKLKDSSEIEQGILLTTTDTGEWQEHCVDLAGYPDVELSEIIGVTLSFNDSFGAAEVWVDDFELR